MKQDPKLVASKENHESEVKYIAKTFKIPIAVVGKAMKDTGVNGQPCRSRAHIYGWLRALGWEIKTRKKPN